MAQKAQFPCRHEGCAMTYTMYTNRLRHEKKCSQAPAPKGSTVVGNVSGHHNVAGSHNSVDNSVTTVNVTLQINAFDDFRPSEISRQKFLEYMTKGATNVILQCLEEEQFNIRKPENMNVFISNLKDKIARVYDGLRWRIRDGDDVIETVLENYLEMINDSIECFEDEENKPLASRIEKWRKNIEKEEFDAYLRKKLLYQLHDGRRIVKDNHNVKQHY